MLFLFQISFSYADQFKEVSRMGCEDGAKMFAELAFDTAQQAKAIRQIKNDAKRKSEVEKLQAVHEKFQDEIFLRTKILKETKAKEDPQRKDYWEIYYLYYFGQAKGALAFGVNHLEYSVIRFQRELEDDCIKSIYRK
jgi:hypothetical protein